MTHMILHDYQCKTCSLKFEELTNKDEVALCPVCKTVAEKIFSVPHPVGVQFFNPHYDFQQGKYFGSKEEKIAHLKQKGQDHYSGEFSPRKTTKTRFICTRNDVRKHNL